LCWALYKERNYSKSPNGKNIEEYKDYIKSFNLVYNQKVWDFIPDLKKIRNCVVHASGDISRRSSQQQSDLKTIIKKGIGIKLGRKQEGNIKPLYLDDDMIFVETSYCESILKNIKALFRTLCEAAGLPNEIEIEM